MNFSQEALRGEESGTSGATHVIECSGKIMESIFHMRSMQLQGDGLYTALLISVRLCIGATFASPRRFFHLTITQIMRN